MKLRGQAGRTRGGRVDADKTYGVHFIEEREVDNNKWFESRANSFCF